MAEIYGAYETQFIESKHVCTHTTDTHPHTWTPKWFSDNTWLFKFKRVVTLLNLREHNFSCVSRTKRDMGLIGLYYIIRCVCVCVINRSERIFFYNIIAIFGWIYLIKSFFQFIICFKLKYFIYHISIFIIINILYLKKIDNNILVCGCNFLKLEKPMFCYCTTFL